MKLPIPADWDGESWTCVRVQWPDSTLWLALLRGLLSTPARGRWWDERSGSVESAQKTGRAIYKANFPFLPCAGEDIESECAGPGGAGGAIYAAFEAPQGENDVGIINLEIRGNELWAQRLPCCEWELIGAFAVTGDYDGSPWEADGMPTPTYSACGRAAAIVDKMYALSTTVWDARSQFPWDYVGYIKAAHPDLVGGDTKLFQAVLQTELTLAFGGEDATHDASKRQNILCRIEAAMQASGEPLSDEEWSAVKTSFAGEFNANPVIGAYWGLLCLAVGRGDMSRVAIAGATTGDQDCRCPGQIGDPTDSWPSSNTWSHWYDFTGQSAPDGVVITEGAHVPGVGLRAYGDQGTLSHPACRVDFAAETGQIKLVYIKYRLGSGLDYEGSAVTAATDTTGLAGRTDAGDTDPSAGGTFTIQKVVDHQLTASDDKLSFKVEARDESGDPTVQRAVVVESVGFAGTGADPVA